MKTRRIALLLICLCGCGFEKQREQQCANRYKAIMVASRNEMVAFVASHPVRTNIPRAEAAAMMREMGALHGKYARLLKQEQPTKNFAIVYYETAEMYAALEIGYTEDARFLEAGEKEKAKEARSRQAHEAAIHLLNLKHWIEVNHAKVPEKLMDAVRLLDAGDSKTGQAVPAP